MMLSYQKELTIMSIEICQDTLRAVPGKINKKSKMTHKEHAERAFGIIERYSEKHGDMPISTFEQNFLRGRGECLSGLEINRIINELIDSSRIVCVIHRWNGRTSTKLRVCNKESCATVQTEEEKTKKYEAMRDAIIKRIERSKGKYITEGVVKNILNRSKWCHVSDIRSNYHLDVIQKMITDGILKKKVHTWNGRTTIRYAM